MRRRILSADMVCFWCTEAIAEVVSSGLVDGIIVSVPRGFSENTANLFSVRYHGDAGMGEL